MGQQQDTMHPTNESIGWYVPAMESEECGMQCILGSKRLHHYLKKVMWCSSSHPWYTMDICTSYW